MKDLFVFPDAVREDPAVEVWLSEHSDELGKLANEWFQSLREAGEDVNEIMHDGCPTACISHTAFAYVNAYRYHINIGFFRGNELLDEHGLLEGTGKRMRHIKIKPHNKIDREAVRALIDLAYINMKSHLAASA